MWNYSYLHIEKNVTSCVVMKLSKVSLMTASDPASREMLDRRWANVVTYVGARSANDVGPMWICP